MLGIEEIISESRLDIVLVHGDTNTTLAGAVVAAAKLHLKAGHVEAGPNDRRNKSHLDQSKKFHTIS